MKPRLRAAPTRTRLSQSPRRSDWPGIKPLYITYNNMYLYIHACPAGPCQLRSTVPPDRGGAQAHDRGWDRQQRGTSAERQGRVSTLARALPYSSTCLPGAGGRGTCPCRARQAHHCGRRSEHSWRAGVGCFSRPGSSGGPGELRAGASRTCPVSGGDGPAGQTAGNLHDGVHRGAGVRPRRRDPGVLISTFFHFQEVRSRWPGRLGDLHFVAIYPDPDLADRIRTRVGGTPERVLVCESEESMAENVAADLSAVLLPCGVRAEPCVIQDTQTPLELLEGGAICLFAPRIWGAVPTDVRDHPRAFEARYRIRPADLDALGSLIGARSDVPGGDNRSFA
jgi:hypothetical protein